MHRTSGIPTKKQFFDNFDNKEVEEFSNNFLKENRENLQTYSTKWVKDPYSTWSRRWEYSYLLERIPKEQKKILDAGSGLTFLPALLKSRGHRVTCLDNDGATIASAKDVGYAAICGDLTTNLEDKFDLVVCISVLEHLSNKKEVLKNFTNLLNDGGRLILTYDICLSGDRDIPYTQINQLNSMIEEFFTPLELYNRDISNAITTNDFVSAGLSHLLPWKSHIPANFTFFCGYYEKK